jgi:low temperature requirement protein LtrA
MILSWGQPPRLHDAHGDQEEERKVGWLELFYDLIYVATIIQLGTLLSDNVSPLGALLFVLLFIPVWWSWTGMMFYFNRFVTDDIWHRLLIFAQMFAIANVAISVTGAYGDTSRDFALSYFAVRIILVVLYARAWHHVGSARPLLQRYTIGFSAASLFWLASAFVPVPYRHLLWVIGLLVEFYVPLSAGSRRLHSLLPPDAPHMGERYGLFTIIVLGESFIKVVDGLAGRGIVPFSLTLSGLGFIITASFWWLYFDRIAGAGIRRTASAPYIWIYTHLPLTIGITALGVSTKKMALLEFGAPLPEHYRWLVCGAVATCLVALSLLDLVSDTGAHSPDRRRLLAYLGAAVLVLALVPLGAYMPAIVLVSIVTLACISQIVFHLRTDRQHAAAGDPLGVVHTL